MFQINRKYFIVFIIICRSSLSFSQESFPLNDPTATLTKGDFGVRVYDETSNYSKQKVQLQNLFGLRLMYGVFSRFSVMASISVSNHHDRILPKDFIDDYYGPSYSTNERVERNYDKYPYLLSGVNIYSKYRFLNIDKENKFFRMAIYLEYSSIKTAHSLAEPNLTDDTGGWGGGLISTCLKNRFSFSFTTGVIFPKECQSYYPNGSYPGLIATTIQYGRAIQYNISAGYKLLPRNPENKNFGKLNIYAEFMGKTYEAAKITEWGLYDIDITASELSSGNYFDFCPGVQYISKSDFRVDFSIKCKYFGTSYSYSYPLYVLGVQKTFSLKKKSK